MATIYVEHRRIEAAAAALRRHKRTFDEVLSTLESDLGPMIGTWSGEARELYLAKKATWDRAALDLTSLLDHIATITDGAHAGYVQAVADVSSAWA